MAVLLQVVYLFLLLDEDGQHDGVHGVQGCRHCGCGGVFPCHVHDTVKDLLVVPAQCPPEISQLHDYAVEQHPETGHCPAHSHHRRVRAELHLAGRDGHEFQHVVLVEYPEQFAVLYHPDDPAGTLLHQPGAPPGPAVAGYDGGQAVGAGVFLQVLQCLFQQFAGVDAAEQVGQVCYCQHAGLPFYDGGRQLLGEQVVHLVFGEGAGYMGLCHHSLYVCLQHFCNASQRVRVEAVAPVHEDHVLLLQPGGMGAQGEQQVGHETRGAFHQGYGGGFEASKVKATGERGWIFHFYGTLEYWIMPCRGYWGNNVRIERGESIRGIFWDLYCAFENTFTELSQILYYSLRSWASA